MKKWLLVLVFAASCAHPPPTLGPDASRAWEKTRVIQGLDVLRDAAIDTEAQKALSTDRTREIVEFHQAALRVIAATEVGWREAVLVSLDYATAQFTPAEQRMLRPYLALVKVLLEETRR